MKMIRILFDKIVRFYLLVALVLVACSNDNGTELTDDNTPQVDDVFYNIESDEVITAMQVAESLFADGGIASGENMETLRNMVYNNIKQRTEALQNNLGVDSLQLAYRKVTYTYNSTDFLGSSVVLSAVVYWNGYLSDGWHDIAPENISLLEHYTITSDAESPSGSLSIEAAFLGNSLVVLPDYQGYGHSKEMLHPYLNHDVHVVNSMDALKAAYALHKNESDGMKDNEWQLVVIGASQGAANALAVHKYFDTHPQVAKEWHFAYSNCAAGPYDPALTFRTYLQWGELSYPVVIPLVLKSMLASYPKELIAWDEENFYSEKFLDIKPQIDTMLASKEYTADEINSVIFENFSVTDGKVKISDMMSADVMNPDSEMMRALLACLEKNNLTKNWTPLHPIKLYHSKGDDVVPYENSEALYSAFGGNMVTLFKSSDTDGHSLSCAKWMLTLFMSGI